MRWRAPRPMPSLRVGLHIVLVEGRPMLPPAAIPDLVDASGQFPQRHGALGDAACSSAPRCAASWPMKSKPSSTPSRRPGLRLDHVNTHKHFHLHPTIASDDPEDRQARTACGPCGCRWSRAACWPPPNRAGPRRRPMSPDPGPDCRAPGCGPAGLLTPDQVFGLAWSGAMTAGAPRRADPPPARGAHAKFTFIRPRPAASRARRRAIAMPRSWRR